MYADRVAEPQPAPIVTVIVPTCGRAHLIAHAVETVRAQTWADWELLIVDDNGEGTESQRATEDEVLRYGDDPRVRYVKHEQNRGASAARNTGSSEARGQYVAFLDDDDSWHPDKLTLQIRCFLEGPADVALVYGGFRRVFADGSTSIVRPDGSAHLLPRLLMENAIGTTSLVMCRRDALLAVGGFDERLPALQDFDLYIRLGLEHPFTWVDAILADHRRQGGRSITTDPEAAVRGHELFYEKHRQLLERNPRVHAYRLRASALVLARSGREREARAAYLRAWWLEPCRISSLTLGLLTHRLCVRGYRAIKGSCRCARVRAVGRTDRPSE